MKEIIQQGNMIKLKRINQINRNLQLLVDLKTNKYYLRAENVE